MRKPYVVWPLTRTRRLKILHSPQTTRVPDRLFPDFFFQKGNTIEREVDLILSLLFPEGNILYSIPPPPTFLQGVFGGGGE